MHTTQASRLVPRPHQVTAINAAVDELLGSSRAQVHMACGTGKTLVGIDVADALTETAGTALVLVPSLALVDQWVRRWQDMSQEWEILAVCSDDNVGSSIEGDGFTTTDLSVPSTTDPRVIAATTERWRSEHRRGVVVCTYASSDALALAHQLYAVPPWDVMVCDEAHRMAGASDPGTTRLWSTALDQDRVPASKRLFMTATPKIHKAPLDDRSEVLTTASMDDEEVFGRIAHTLTFSQAVAQDLLNDFRVLIIGIEEPEFDDLGDEFSAASSHQLIAQVALAKAMRTYGLTSALVFHNRVARSVTFADGLPHVVKDLGPQSRPTGPLVASLHIDGSTPKARRESSFERLRTVHTTGGWAVLSNCRCVVEGVDLPALDAVVMADVRTSSIDVTQAVGRVMRKNPHRDGPSYVILPVKVPAAASEAAAIDASDFRSTYQVITALADHDDRLQAHLTTARTSLRETSNVDADAILPQVHVILPDRLTRVAERLIKLRIVQHTTPAFWQYFGALQRYVAQYGTSRVHHSEYVDPDGVKLGAWVKTRRSEYRQGILSTDRAAALAMLPGWTWDPLEDDWQQAYQQLAAIADATGAAVAPPSHELWPWIQRHRTAMRRGKLPVERQKRLEELPGWTWNAVDTAWEEGFQELAAHVASAGTAHVPGGFSSPSGFGLGRWVTEQRRRLKTGLMQTWQKERLEALPGWSWDPNGDLWRRMRQRAMQQYQAGAVIPETSDLGIWVAKQRSLARRGKLPEDRRAVLQATPGWVWEPLQAAWEQGYAAAKDYADLHGHLKVGSDVRTSSGLHLAGWLTRQRKDFREGRLSATQVERLNLLPGWSWDPSKTEWEEKFRVLLTHVKDHGPRNFSAAGLGDWVKFQRRRVEKGSIDADELMRLRSVLGEGWPER